MDHHTKRHRIVDAKDGIWAFGAVEQLLPRGKPAGVVGVLTMGRDNLHTKSRCLERKAIFAFHDTGCAAVTEQCGATADKLTSDMPPRMCVLDLDMIDVWF